MGDMADYANSNLGFEEYLISPTIRRIRRRPRLVVCKYCGKPELRWVELKGGWRLYRRNQVHSCEEYGRTLEGA